jgi:hypothetical protein
MHVPTKAGSISDTTLTATHWGVAGTRILSENGCYVGPDISGPGRALTEAAMSYAKPC